MIGSMDATTIDQEFEQLQAEFQDVAKTVQTLAGKMQAAEQAGDANAADWLADLKRVAQDVDDEQAQVQKLLLAIHDFVGGLAQTEQAPAAEKPPLFAPGHEPAAEDEQQQPGLQRHGMLGGMLGGMMGGGMLGGGMFGGYYGGGFGRAMEMGMAMNLGANLVSSIFR
jgi:hypothetical protein